MTPQSEPITGHGPWQKRLRAVMESMRELSLQSDPQAMVAAYGRRMQELLPVDCWISLSRRELTAPRVRITRFSGWDGDVNPWKEKDRLPILDRGLLSELIYSDQPRIIDDLQLDPDDPAVPYLAGQRSLVAIPMLDGGVALNMVISARKDPGAFDPENLPEHVWMANLFGRATHNLVLAEQVKQAFDLVDRELQVVADIQQSLLPERLPDIPTMKLAAHYRTSRRAGGDYYDFFHLPNGRWGILIADVSGHGTPAAVVMAVTHSIAHMYPATTDLTPVTPPPGIPAEEWQAATGSPEGTRSLAESPGRMLSFVNHHLARRYVGDFGTFVTAFYGIYDPASRLLRYASAGHNPPRVRRCMTGDVVTLGGTRNFPLGVSPEEAYQDKTYYLSPGDQIIFYTDGLTETHSPAGEIWGTDRLDDVLAKCTNDPHAIIESILSTVDEFAGGRAPDDDRTLVVAKIL